MSRARQQGIKNSEIFNRGCWSRENTFTKFYDKDIIKSNCNDFDCSCRTILDVKLFSRFSVLDIQRSYRLN